MKIEIEAKLKVDSLERAAERLKELGAEFVERQCQIDHYFDDDKGSMKKNDKALRIRRQKTESGETVLLAFKGAGEKGKFKTRKELEIRVSDFRAASEILEGLGYREKIVVEKERRIWHYRGCEVALDHLPELGDFVEIEGRDDAGIETVKKDMQLGSVPHIPHSYASMAAKKLCEKQQ